MDLEDQHRFQVEGLASCEDAQLVLSCHRCAHQWVFDGPLNLAELDQRADEHTEVCR